jgi:hypothetical protein
MPPPDPLHLFEQADGLITAAQPEGPRQEDLRRAISATYYGVFHFTLTAAANMIVVEELRSTELYGLVYRSVDHTWLRALCEEVQKATIRRKWQRYTPPDGFGSIVGFAAAVSSLQELRYAADYDPLFRVDVAQAKLALKQARTAVEVFHDSTDTQRKAFLFLLLFKPRG